MLAMWVCPVCGRSDGELFCRGCGFDSSRDCESFLTLTKPTQADWRYREERRQKKNNSSNSGKLKFGKGMAGWKWNENQ